MLKKIIILTFLILVIPFSANAETVTTITNSVPLQESYNSPKVIDIIPIETELTLLSQNGRFLEVEYKDLSGWVNISYTDKSSISNLSGNSTFAQIAKNRKEFISQSGYYYALYPGIVIPLETKPYEKRLDCSAFVSEVVYWYGELRNNTDLMKLGRMAGDFRYAAEAMKVGKTYVRNGVDMTQHFDYIPSMSEAKAGDILIYNGHVEIFEGSYADSGKAKVYNCGSNYSINRVVTVASRYPSEVISILRIK